MEVFLSWSLVVGQLVRGLEPKILGTFISKYKYESECEYDFSNQVLMLWIVTFHINLACTDSLLFNWSATGSSEGSGNITGLKFKSRSGTRSRTPI